jgi:hypothetical protein
VTAHSPERSAPQSHETVAVVVAPPSYPFVQTALLEARTYAAYHAACGVYYGAAVR